MKSLWLFCAVTLYAAGTVPRPDASGYPAHAPSLGAEYLVRTVFAAGQSFVTPDYLVIEVAVYPAAGEPRVVSTGDFMLRINGAKRLVLAQPPGFVAASLKYDDWTRRPTLVGTAGTGGADVIIGRPRRSERFPGDPASRERLPAPPRAPGEENRSGQDTPPPPRAEDAVNEYALPEGSTASPVSGYLYFAFKGKPASIRSLELVYKKTGGNEVTLRLR
jgi:hypothetical protein